MRLSRIPSLLAPLVTILGAATTALAAPSDAGASSEKGTSTEKHVDKGGKDIDAVSPDTKALDAKPLDAKSGEPKSSIKGAHHHRRTAHLIPKPEEKSEKSDKLVGKGEEKSVKGKTDVRADVHAADAAPPAELTGSLPQAKIADRKPHAPKIVDATPTPRRSVKDGKDTKSTVHGKATKPKDLEDDALPSKDDKAHKHTTSATIDLPTLPTLPTMRDEGKTASSRKHKICLHPTVSFTRLGQPTDVAFPLTTCAGGPAPGALDHLSVLARPYDRAAPTTIMFTASSAGKPMKAMMLDSDDVAPGIRRLDAGLVERMQSVADHFPGRTITVVSGWRPQSTGSPHAAARALDVRIDGVTDEALVAYCKTLVDTGCGYYPNSSFVHVDVRPEGAGHVYWIDVSGPGEKPVYVKQWPLAVTEATAKAATIAPAASEATTPAAKAGEVKSDAKPTDAAPPSTETPAETTKETEIAPTLDHAAIGGDGEHDRAD